MTLTPASQALAHIAQPASCPTPHASPSHGEPEAEPEDTSPETRMQSRSRAAQAMGWTQAEVVSGWKLPPEDDGIVPVRTARSLGSPVTGPMDGGAAQNTSPDMAPSRVPEEDEEPPVGSVPEEDKGSPDDPVERAPFDPVGSKLEEQIKLAEAEALTPEEEERFAIFEKIGRSRHQMMSVDLGALDVDAHFDALEQSLADDQATKVRSPPPKKAVVRDLDELELMAELSTLVVDEPEGAELAKVDKDLPPSGPDDAAIEEKLEEAGDAAGPVAEEPAEAPREEEAKEAGEDAAESVSDPSDEHSPPAQDESAETAPEQDEAEAEAKLSQPENTNTPENTNMKEGA